MIMLHIKLGEMKHTIACSQKSPYTLDPLGGVEKSFFDGSSHVAYQINGHEI